MTYRNLERNKEIMIDYLFEDISMQKVADKHNISRERVRQILEAYGITNKPQSQLRIRMDRLLDFIIKYKIENDGNSPGKMQMRDGANLSTSTRVDGALVALEKMGLITFSYNYTGKAKTKFKINIVGAKWIPPDDYEIGE